MVLPADAVPNPVPVQRPPPPATKHPSFSVMVMEAVRNLNETKGSSLKAIEKYMNAKYDLDVKKMVAHTKKALKSCMADGQVINATGIGLSGRFKLGKAKKTTKKKVLKVLAVDTEATDKKKKSPDVKIKLTKKVDKQVKKNADANKKNAPAKKPMRKEPSPAAAAAGPLDGEDDTDDEEEVYQPAPKMQQKKEQNMVVAKGKSKPKIQAAGDNKKMTVKKAKVIVKETDFENDDDEDYEDEVEEVLKPPKKLPKLQQKKEEVIVVAKGRSKRKSTPATLTPKIKTTAKRAVKSKKK